MPISNIESHAGPFYPDGIVTDFPFAFDMFVTDGAPGIAVARIAEDGSSAIVDPGLYGVIPGEQGGTIRFAAAPAAGDPLFILATPSFKQQIAFSNQAPYLPEVVTDALDRAAARDIYMNGLLQRAILMPPGETVGNAPIATDRAGKVLGFDDTGELLVDVSYTALMEAAAKTVAYADIARQAAQQSVAANIEGRPVKEVTSDYALTDEDLAFHIRINTSSIAKIMFDPTIFRDGWYATLEQRGPSPFYIRAASGTALRSKNGYDEVNVQYGVATLVKTLSNEGVAYGDLNALYSPPPPPTLAPPVIDGFAGISASITGRITDLGGKTWTSVAYTGSNASPIITDGSGFISGTQGTAPNSTFVYINVTASNRKWVRRTGKVSMYENGGTIGSSFLQVSHLSATTNGGTASLSGIALQHTGATGVAAASQLRCFNAGVVGAASSFGTFITKVDGDTTDIVWNRSGSDRTATHFLNGRQYGPSINVSQMAQAPSDWTENHGFRGNIGASRVDGFMVGDPDTHPMIRQYAPQRVVQREADGSVNVKPRGTLTMQDPGSLKVRIEDSVGTALIDWTMLGSYVIAGLDFEGAVPNLSTPPSTGFVCRVRREDGTGPSTIEGNPSPLWKAGENILWDGQSLETNATFATSGGIDAAPSDCWLLHGTIGQGATATYPNDYDRRMIPVSNNSPLATFSKTAQDATSSYPTCHIIAGRGGTDASQRLPGTTNYSAMIDGIRHAGNDFGSFIHIGGQFDVASPTLIANYISNVRATLLGAMAQSGRLVKGLMVPLTSVWGASDLNSETLRKAMWQACQDYPDLFYWGPMLCDIQHNSGDVYHFTAAGYVEELRRCASAWNLMKGNAVLDLRGPTLFSVSKDSSSQCTVMVDLNGADSITLLNYTSDRRGGLRFAASSDFALVLEPTGHSIGAIASGKQAITYTFSGAPFASSSVFVSGPYGTEPFNPSGDATIRADYANKASMLVGQYTGKSNIPIQPYYQTGGLGDYITGS